MTTAQGVQTVHQLQRTRRVLIVALVVAFVIELIARLIDDAYPLFAEALTLLMTVILLLTVYAFIRFFLARGATRTAIVIAAIAGTLNTSLRFIDRVFETVRGESPFRQVALYSPLVTTLDFTTFAFLVIGLFLIVFEIAHARTELAAKTVALEEEIEEHHRTQEARHQLEQQLLHAQKMESIGLLAGGVAHDFNNILTGILGNARLVLEELPKNSPLYGSLEAIEKGANHAADLTRQLLAYAGKADFKLETLDLSQVVREMVDLLQVSVSKSVELKLDLESGLPPVYGDAVQLRHVILNLLTNAAEALDNRPGTVRVRTGVRACSVDYLASGYISDALPDGDYVFLTVDDSGAGMDSETLARIFDPYFSTKFPGRGLGLSSALGIIRAHRGTLMVESRPDAGTRFTILLPASAEAAVEPAEPSERAPEPAAQNGTVLIIEDEDTVRRVAKTILSRAGYTVLEAADGQQGLETFARHAEDITAVLLDLTMPRMDGGEVYERIRALRPSVNVVVSTGHGDQDARTFFNGGLPPRIIKKPYRPNDLLEALHS